MKIDVVENTFDDIGRLIAEQCVGASLGGVSPKISGPDAERLGNSLLGFHIRTTLAGLPARYGHIARVETICKLLLGKPFVLTPFGEVQTGWNFWTYSRRHENQRTCQNGRQP